MTTSSHLLDLANAIQAQVSEIQDHLRNTGQLDPTFDGEAPPTHWSGIDDLRSSTLENLTQLQDLLSTPLEILQSKPITDPISRHAFDRFGIYQLVPTGGSATYEDLAASSGIPLKTLRRLIRHGISQRIFREPQPGCVAHTQASRLVAENVKVRDYLGTVCQEVWPAAARTVDAIERWPGSMKRDETGYQLAHGRDLYATLAADPVKQARYDSAMGANSSDRTHSLHHVLDNYDWAALGEATIVDVGGGIGTVSKALAKAFPQLKFVVEDRPDVLVKASVEDAGEDVKSRIRFLEHDFFTPQPIRDGDVYFIRRVMMEWPDAKVVEIIKALKPALKAGAIVLVQDSYTPEPGWCQLWQERKLRNADMLAIAIANGGSREREEWPLLFDRAGPGFDFKGVKSVPNSDIVFVEAVWQGGDGSQ